MDEENMNPEEKESGPVDSGWTIGEGMIPITDYKGGILGQLKISSVSIDHKEGIVVEAVDVKVFGNMGVSVVEIDCIDLTYETLQKILSLTEGPEI